MAGPRRSWTFGQITWLLWGVGFLLLAASWFGVVSPQVGWFGFWLTAATAFLSWVGVPLGAPRRPAPPKRTGPLAKAEELVARGRFEQAEAIYHEILLNEPDSLDAHLGLAECRRRQGDLDGAEAAARLAMAAEPASAAPHTVLGNLALDRRDLRGAIGAFERALDLAPGSVWPHWGLAQAHERLHDPAEAIHHLDAIPQLAPGSPLADDARARAAALRDTLRAG
jgi:tetratricopeptide (TPR) repeat protein